MTPTHAPIIARPRTGRDIAGALAAAATLLGFVVGLPLVLSVVAPLRLPTTWPTWEAVRIGMFRPDDGSLLIGAMTLAAWGCWAVFTASVLTDLVAGARHVRVPTIPLLGWAQHTAATLLTTAGLLVTTAAPVVSATGGGPAIVQIDTTPARYVWDQAPSAPPGTGTATGMSEAVTRTTASVTPAPAVEVDRHPVVTVARGDTLWSLAEHHLGAGTRYIEIRDLNLGQPQPDGRVLTDAHWIYPGWQIRLPLDATDVPASAMSTNAGAAVESATTVHAVVPGDTLWDIAAHHLGDGARYTEIYGLNTGAPQPGGRTLTDPDLIHPGWNLTLPATTPAAVALPSAAVPIPEPAAPTEARPRLTRPDSPDVEPRAFAPATAGPPASRALDDAAADLDGNADNDSALEPGITTTLVLGLTAMASGGLVAEIARRRRRQHRLRRAGERIPVPDPGSVEAATEHDLRRAVEPLTFTTLRRGLHILAATCSTAGRALPGVGAIIVGTDTLDLLLIEDDDAPVQPFTAVDVRTWRTSHDAFIDQEPSVDLATLPDPYPALVTVGLRDQDTVLVNLEAAGALSITGPPAAAAQTLRALACELVTSPLTSATQVVLAAEFADLAAVSDPLAVKCLDARAMDRRRGLAAKDDAMVLAYADADDALQARSQLVGDEIWIPTVFVGGAADSAPAPWAGHVVVGAGERAPWTLNLDDDGMGRLEPMGIALRSERVSAENYAQLVRVLGDAQQQPVRSDASVPASIEVQCAEVSATLGSPTVGSVEDASAASAVGNVAAPYPEQDGARHEAPRVLVLGRVAVTGIATPVGNGRERRNTELVAFLALNPGATAEEVDEVVGHGTRVGTPNRNAHISRARSWLGTDPDGLPYLERVGSHNDYRLHPAVRTDWDDFRELLRRGADLGEDGGPELRAALELVRGRPFTGVPRGTYEWADGLSQQMTAHIVDAAHLFAVISTAPGAYRAVREALAIGLVADPCNEMLYRDAIKAAHRVGDHDDVERLVGQLRDRIEQIDPDGDLEDETLELLEALDAA